MRIMKRQYLWLLVPLAPIIAFVSFHLYIEWMVELTDKNGHHMSIRSSAAVDVARLVATFCAGERGAT